MAQTATAIREREPRLARAEPVVRRLLLVPQKPAPRRRTAGADAAAHRLFNVSIALSGLRCLLGYVVLPIITPALGAAASVAPIIGIPIAVVALVFDVMAVRRFWLADHRWRWPGERHLCGGDVHGAGAARGRRRAPGVLKDPSQEARFRRVSLAERIARSSC